MTVSGGVSLWRFSFVLSCFVIFSGCTVPMLFNGCPVMLSHPALAAHIYCIPPHIYSFCWQWATADSYFNHMRMHFNHSGAHKPTWLLGRGHQLLMVVPRQLLLSRSGRRALNHLRQCASIHRDYQVSWMLVARLMNTYANHLFI